MIVNAYSVLDAFTAFLRLVSGFLVVGLGLPAWWKWKAALPSENAQMLEDRSYFLFLLVFFLAFLNLASWPLFYLMLQSYVPEFPDLMCIYGVTQIGADSLGPSRFLPGLLTALQIIKPALIFLTGAWLVLYLLNRRTATAPLMSRVLVAAIVLGLLAVFDAGTEGAYLLISKKEEIASSGCCTVAIAPHSFSLRRFLDGWLGEDHEGSIVGVYYGVNAGITLALAVYLGRSRWRATGARLLPLGVGALISLAVNIVFLVEIAAPALLHTPNHHCAYDLVEAVPESVAAFALFLLGFFAVGWACVAGCLGNSGETRPFLGPLIGHLLFLGLASYVASVLMLSLEISLALP